MVGAYTSSIYFGTHSNGFPGGGGAAGYACVSTSVTCCLSAPVTAIYAKNCCYGINGDFGAGNGGFGGGGGGGYGSQVCGCTCNGGGKGGCGGGGGGGFSVSSCDFPCNSNGSCGGNGVAMVEYWIL